MQLTQQQLEAALAAGLYLTNPLQGNSNLPGKHWAGGLVLHEILSGIASGQLAIVNSPVQKEEDPEDPETPEDD